MSSKIEQIIDEIEEFIDGCKTATFNQNNIIVNRETIEELIAELRSNTPDEIKKYQKIISNTEAILADARAKADTIIAQAEIHTNELVSEHQIMQQAYAQANEVVMIATKQAQEILDNATRDANEIRTGAITYTDNLMNGVEEVLSKAIETNVVRSEQLNASLSSYLDTIVTNRLQLVPQEASSQPATNSASAATAEKKTTEEE